MAALNEYLLLERLIKGLLSVVFCMYLFGILWYPNSKYAALYLICIIGLSFRFCFSIKGDTSFWKIIIVVCFYSLFILDQISNLLKGDGSLWLLINSPSSVVVVALLIAMLSDVLRYRYLKQKKQFKD